MNHQLSDEQIRALAAIDTPTVCNAIESFNVRGRVEGFLGMDIRCLSPELGVMTGYAVTARVDASTPDAPPDQARWEDWVRAMETAPKPAVLVFQDVGPNPRRSAHCGEVMATLARRLGVTGLVTDGGVRDILEVRGLAFHYFAAGLVPSHGTTRFVEVNVPVTLDGVLIRPGDLIHGDINGVTTIPAEIAAQVAQEAQRVREREAGVMAYTRDPGFNLEGFFQRMFSH
jgi:4-hydroxy-4-methyl-2-oxoglutarate aldolase